jgi:hypothetical protein
LRHPDLVPAHPGDLLEQIVIPASRALVAGRRIAKTVAGHWHRGGNRGGALRGGDLGSQDRRASVSLASEPDKLPIPQLGLNELF